VERAQSFPVKREKKSWLWKLKATILLEVSGHIHQKFTGHMGGRLGGCMDPWTVNRPQATAGAIAMLSNPLEQSHIFIFSFAMSVLQGTRHTAVSPQPAFQHPVAV